jgi:hypothetical protein
MKLKLRFLVFLLLLGQPFVRAQSFKVLFDARKAEMAGDADWVVDADQFNLGRSASGAMVTGAGDESNPQRTPTPAQSGITSSTAETYWKGALSYWAVDLVRRGFTVESLPYNGSITYGNTANPQDLSNYKVYIVVEPNILFTSAEKTAILDFVRNGGGLFIGGNHNGSDRNNDGSDSRAVWNDLFTNNGTVSNPFGISFDATSFSQTTSNLASLSGNPVLYGPAGTVTGLQYNSGTSMTISRTANPNVTALIYKTGASRTGTTQVMFATSKYGSGKVCAIGDSSPSDDGTGDTNDALYSSYASGASGSHRKLFQNAVLWLSSTAPEPPVSGTESTDPGTSASRLSPGYSLPIAFPNPARDLVTVQRPEAAAGVLIVSLFDLCGRQLATYIMPEESEQLPIDLREITSGPGIYLIRVQGPEVNISLRLVRGE